LQAKKNVSSLQFPCFSSYSSVYSLHLINFSYGNEPLTTPFSNTPRTDTAGVKQVSLAAETSGRLGSVALGIGNSIVAKADLSGFRRHSSELLGVIENLLKRHHLGPQDINRIYIPKGPGSFTGIRIAVTFAKMAAFALNAKIAAIDTLDAIAENSTQFIQNKSLPIQRLAAILDAKRGLFYIAVFEWQENDFRRITEDLLITPADFLQRFCSTNAPLHLLGEGLLFYQKQFEHPQTVILDKTLWPARAESLWRLGQKRAQNENWDDPDTLAPLYIRRPEAEELWEKNSPSAL
jgi:tRNA threonylcarbamoyladenosine biosynthesis protein TsaB